MANDRVVLCGNVDRKHLPWDDRHPIEFRVSGPHWNIRPGLPRIREDLLREVPDRFCDLIEIATYVYVADQAASRGGEGVDNVGEDWYRNLFFRIPVREPEFWNEPRTHSTLTQTLARLSDDHYQFDFVPLVDPPELQTYFDFGAEYSPLPHHPDVVALFSGGLDSLAGAVQEAVVNSRKMALVMHRSTDKFAPRHRALHEGIAQRAKYSPFLFPVKINKKKNLNHEYTQRSRSFLYVSLGAVFAEMFNLPDVRLYENGIVSLNLPIAEQAVGTRSTRTTHPQVLEGFSDIISLVAERPIRVHNPFVWKTKQEIVEIIRDAGCADLIGNSISCAHAAWGVEPGKTHCGVCSQCIDRRLAVLAADMTEHDPIDLYSSDLLTAPRSDGEHKLMIASYAATAESICDMKTPKEFFGTFGMASRAFEAFPDRSPDSVAQDLYRLHKKHAEAVIGVLDNAVAVHAKAIRSRSHHPECLVRLISDSGDLDQNAASAMVAEAPLNANAFKKKGGGWVIRFAGGEEFIATPSKGIACLHMLLSSPNKLIRATKLVENLVAEPHAYQLEFKTGDAGEVLDKDAARNYFARLHEIEAVDLPAAGNDLVRKDELITERTWLEAELKRCGLHSNRRDKDDRNRIRNRVGNAIKNAIEKQIRPFDSQLADHLQKPRLQKGYELCYSPGEELDWELW